jgi:NAD(P)-dependent dehydrogenase (short-subunit alcohol dehydrogenase family)
MHLAGRTAVVLGVTGNVGWGAAKAFLKHGARVVGVTRSPEQARALPDLLGAPDRVTALVADLSTPEGARSLADQLAAGSDGNDGNDGYDHVFASMGPWWQKGPIVEQSGDEYREVMRANLDCQVFAAQALIPPIRRRSGASYTIVTGQGGHASIPGTGLLVIAVSGVFGLSRMLRLEHAADPVRVNELLISARVERAPRPGVVPAEEFGESAAAIAGSLLRGEVVRYDSPQQFTAAMARSSDPTPKNEETP